MLASLFYATFEQFPRKILYFVVGPSVKRATRQHDLYHLILLVLEWDEL